MGDGTAGADDDLKARREAIIHAHIDAENRFDVDGVLDSMKEHNYNIVPYDVEISGRETVREFMSGHFVTMPTIVSEATRFYHCDDAVGVEVHVEGTHGGEIEGIPANGNPIDVNSFCIFFFDEGDDGILGERVYSDMLSLMRQISGETAPA